MMHSPKLDVVGVGLNATDTFIPVAHYPARGSKVEFRLANVLPGGQVATAMIACQQWGLRTRYVGKVGDDNAAELHRAEFERAGVEAHLFTAPGCPSQQAMIRPLRPPRRAGLAPPAFPSSRTWMNFTPAWTRS